MALPGHEELAAWRLVLDSRDYGRNFERRLRRSPEFAAAVAMARDLRAFFPARLAALVQRAEADATNAGDVSERAGSSPSRA